MKKNVIIIILALAISMFVLPERSFCQGPPAPPTDAGHGVSGNQNGGSAPIGGGIFILLGMAGAYGTRKMIADDKKKD